MSDAAIFFIGACVSLPCVAFVVASAIGLREAGRDDEERPSPKRASRQLR